MLDTTPAEHQFSGNIFIFQAFDVGDDINLEKVKDIRAIHQVPLQLSKYFKAYHTPIAIELPHPHESSSCIGSKIHNFGAISLTYQIPFDTTLAELRKEIPAINYNFQGQSVTDVKSIYKKIQPCIGQPYFFQTRASYLIIQVDQQPKNIDVDKLQKNYGAIVTSMLRFETQALAEYQIHEMLEDAIGYFRGDLIVVDTDASFVYDDDYPEILDFFEFANIQQLELQFFDRSLENRLNKIYKGEGRAPSFWSYIPFTETLAADSVQGINKLRVDISVISERLEGAIKIAGEPYFSELYDLLVAKLNLKSWQTGIDRKLGILHDIQSIYQSRVDTIREDMLTVLIIILIFIELVIGILSYLK